MSDLVENGYPEDRFSRVAAHVKLVRKPVSVELHCIDST